MTTPPRSAWLPPTLTLCASYLAATGVMIGIATVVPVPGFIAKAGPFIAAGLVTGRIVGAPARTPAIIAAAAVALLASLAWTTFSFVTSDLAPDRALVLLGASLPVMLIGGVWAYVGMMLGGRREPAPTQPSTTAPTRTPTQAELDDLEGELTREAARERGD